MRQAAKWLGLVALTAVLVPFAEIPSFFKGTEVLIPTALAQSAADQKAEADRLLDFGVQQFERNQLQQALATWEQALDLYVAVNDKDGQGTILAYMGIAHASLRNHDRAIEFFEQQLDIAREIGDRTREGNALGNLGAAYADLGDYHRAINFHERHLAITRDTDDLDGEGRALGNLSNAYWTLSDYHRTIELAEQQLSVAQSTNNQYQEGAALNSLGNAYWKLEDYDHAIMLYEQALEIARVTGDWGGARNALNNLGIVYRDLGDYHHAIELIEQALEIAHTIGDENGEIIALNNLSGLYITLGQTYAHSGDYYRAIELYEQSLEIARATGNQPTEGSAIGSLSSVYRELGDYHYTVELAEKALAIFRDVNDQVGESNALNSLGIAHFSFGNYYLAIELYEQSLEISRAIGDQGIEGSVLGNLGSVYQIMGSYHRAIEFHEQFLAITQQVGDRVNEGVALGNLGNAYLILGNFDQALNYYELSREIAQEIGDQAGEGIILGYLGNNARSRGNYQQAINFHEQALAIARELGGRVSEGAALGNLGGVYYLMGDYPRSIEFSEQYLTITREIGDRSGEGTALNNLGAAYLKKERFSLAEVALTQALDVWDTLRDSDLPDTDKIALFEIQQRSFLLLQRALVAQDKVGPALEVAERGRGRAFAELLSQRLSSENTVLDAAPPQLSDIKALAQEQQTTLITYSVIRFDDEDDDGVLHIWVVSPTGDLTFRRQPLDGVDLASLVTTARQSLGVRGDRLATAIVELTPETLARQQAETEANLRQLYDLLIAPIADLLPTDPTQPVVFMPQDELFLVPFAALKAPDGQYLIENHTILTSPSIQVFGLATEAKAATVRANGGSLATRNPLIVGNPTMPSVTFLSEGGTFQDVQLDPLPGAQREAEAISGFLQTPALLGRAATKTAVQQRMAEADVIHLATHGLLEYGDPRQTGTRDLPGAIALAPGSGDDGLLTAGEILQMDLRADLAVLSACDTGRGRITGDGVIGLSRAFVAAGVPSIIVSLWAVDDQATADLMVAFYDHWQQSGDKAQALRQAMLTTMENHPDPRLWSAFTLIGSPN